MKGISDETVRGYVRALNDFGYRIDFDHCRKTVDGLVAGEKLAGGPSAFIKKWLQEADLLPNS